MHPADIKAAIEKAGGTQASVARSLTGRAGSCVSRMAVLHVIKGASKSARIAQRISEVTGLPVSVLWPGKYPDLEKSEAIARARAQLAAQGVREPIRRPRAAPTATRSPK